MAYAEQCIAALDLHNVSVVPCMISFYFELLLDSVIERKNNGDLLDRANYNQYYVNITVVKFFQALYKFSTITVV